MESLVRKSEGEDEGAEKITRSMGKGMSETTVCRLEVREDESDGSV